MDSKKPLWTCPKCGHKFVTKNLWHSCSRHSLHEHFQGKDPKIRKLFNAYVRIVRGFGPVTVYAQKTRIVFQVRVRFAGAIVRKKWIEGGMWLKRRADHPRFHRIEVLLEKDYVHYFKITVESDLDPELTELLKEAYAIGCQAHRNKGIGSL